MKNTTNLNTVSLPERKKPKLVVFCGDIHSSIYFPDFVSCFPSDTKFSLCGDIWDRGPMAFEAYVTIKTLHEEGRLDLCLGNHDIFLMGAGFLDRSKSKFAECAREKLPEAARSHFAQVFMGQLMNNQGDVTIRSFQEHAVPGKFDLLLDEVVDFLAEFGLYSEEQHSNALVCHGGLAILVDGSVVTERIQGRFVSGSEYLKELDIGFRNIDANTLLRLTAVEKGLGEQILSGMLEAGVVIDPKIAQEESGHYPTNFCPTWYANSTYVNPKYPAVAKSLRTELDKAGKKFLVVGHWGNDGFKVMDGSSADVLRLDRSHIGYSNFGFAVFDVENQKIIHTGDVIDNPEIGRDFV